MESIDFSSNASTVRQVCADPQLRANVTDTLRDTSSMEVNVVRGCAARRTSLEPHSKPSLLCDLECVI